MEQSRRGFFGVVAGALAALALPEVKAAPVPQTAVVDLGAFPNGRYVITSVTSHYADFWVPDRMDLSGISTSILPDFKPPSFPFTEADIGHAWVCVSKPE